MKLVLLSILSILCIVGHSQIHYNPPKAGIVQNAPTSFAQAIPSDSRSKKYDSIKFVWREFVDTAEVNRYFNVLKMRDGQFPIWVNTGGTINTSTGYIDGGVNNSWVYRNGTADSNLVLMNTGGGGAANLDTTRTPTIVTVTNSAGTPAIIKSADSTLAGAVAAADQRTLNRKKITVTSAELRLQTPLYTTLYEYKDQYSNIGNFYYDPFSTIPDDSVMSITPSTGVGRYLRDYKNEVQAEWFGAIPNDGTDDTRAFQKALDFAIKYSTAAKVRCGGGVFNIKNLIMYRKTTGGEYQFVTASIQGATPVFDGSITLGPVTVFENSDTASFIVAIEKGRNCLVKDIAFKGPNSIAPSVQNIIEWTDAQWTNLTRNNTYSPSALIVIDPFHSSVAAGNQYPGLSAWYTNSSNGGTSEVQLDGLALRFANVGVMVSPNGSTQNCDNISLINSTVEGMKVAWATGQTQSRNNSMTNIYSLGSIQYMVNGADYGAGQGSAPNITKCNFAGGLKYLYYIGSNFSGMNIDNSYMESIWSLGKSNGLLPVSFNNTQISLMIPDDNSVFAPPVIAEGAELNFNSGSIEWFDNNSNVGFPFNVTSILFNGTALRGNMPINNVTSSSYDRTAYTGVKIYGNNADGIIYDRNTLNIPVNQMRGKPILPGMIITGDIGETYRSVDPTKVQTIFTENKVLTINTGSHTATFKAANPKKYQVNDALMTTTGVTYSNSIYSSSSTSLGYISSIGADSTITLHYVPYGLSGVTTYDINIYRIPKFIPRTIGDIVSGSDTIRNVVYDISSFNVGDRIRAFDKNTTVSYGITSGTYVKYVDLAGGKIAISIPATATINNQVFQDAALVKESRGQDTVLGASAVAQVFAPGDIIWNNHGLTANDSIAGWQCYFPGKTTTAVGPLFVPIRSGGGGSSYTLPIATTSILGGIKPDGSTITVNPTTGVASSSGGGGTPPAFYPQSYTNFDGSAGNPDSTTDNTNSINAAIAAAYAAYKASGYKQVVKLSAGVWGVRSAYRDTAVVYKPVGIIMYPGVTLEGAGTGSTVISLLPPPVSSTFNSSTFITNSKFGNIISATNTPNIVIRDLAVNGKISNQINYNINPYLSPQPGLGYDSCTDAIRLTSSSGVVIERVKIDSVSGFGVSVVNSLRSIVDKSVIGWNINGGVYYQGSSDYGRLTNSNISYSSCDNIRLRCGNITIENNEISWSKYNPNPAVANFAGIYTESYLPANPITNVLIANNKIHDNSSYALDLTNLDTNAYTFPMTSILVTGNHMYRNANAGVQVQAQQVVITDNIIERNGKDSLGVTDPFAPATIGIVLHGKNSNNTIINGNKFINNTSTQRFAWGSTSVAAVPLLTVTNNTVYGGNGIVDVSSFGTTSGTTQYGNSWTDSASNVRTSDMTIDSTGALQLSPNTGEFNFTKTGIVQINGTNDASLIGSHANSFSRGFEIYNKVGANAMLGVSLNTKGTYSSSTPTTTSARNIVFKDWQTATNYGGVNADGDFVWGSTFTNNVFIAHKFGTALNGVPAQVEVNGVSSGSTANQQQIGFRATLAAGYTGSGYPIAVRIDNLAAGTGNSLSGVTATKGNYGIFGGATGAASSGSNIGGLIFAYNGLRNAGIIGDASFSQFNSASALSAGVIGYGLRQNSSAIHMGGFFGLISSEPTFENGALISDNGATGDPSFIARINGAQSFVVDGTGKVFAKNLTASAQKYILHYNPSTKEITYADSSAGGGGYTIAQIRDSLQLDTTWHSRTFQSTTATTFNVDTIYFTGAINEVLRITCEMQSIKTDGSSYQATKTMFYQITSAGTITDGTGDIDRSDQYIPTGGLTSYTFSITRTGARIFIQCVSESGTIDGKISYQVQRQKH